MLRYLAHTLRPAALVLGVLAAVAAAQAQEVRRGSFEGDVFVAGDSVDVEAEVAGGLVATGGWVEVVATVAGDLFTAGGTATLDARVANDLFWAGGMADIGGSVGDKILAAGGTVTIDADVGGKVMAAGGRIRLGRSAAVRDAAWLAGGSIEIAGEIDGDVAAVGGRIAVLGTVMGDVQVAGGALEVGPGARIGGALTFHGPEPPAIADGAEIGGEVRHVPRRFDRGPIAIDTTRIFGVGAILFLLGLIVLAAAVALLLPGYADAAARRLRAHPWQSAGLGLALLIATPVVIALLFVTIVGLPLGLTAVFGYLALIFIGWVIAAFSLGSAVAGRWPAAAHGWRRWLLYPGAIVVLGLLTLVPVVGGVIAIVALVLGVGAATGQAYRAWAGPPGAPPAAATA